jgi:hypothetical protein
MSTPTPHTDPAAAMIQSPLRLLLTALLGNMLTSMMPQLNEELRTLELPNAEGNREFQVRWECTRGVVNKLVSEFWSIVSA